MKTSGHEDIVILKVTHFDGRLQNFIEVRDVLLLRIWFECITLPWGFVCYPTRQAGPNCSNRYKLYEYTRGL
jgi:hypothetical protein